MSKKTGSYRESLLEELVDPLEASEYIDAAMEDSQEASLKALKNVAQAQTMTKVAINRPTCGPGQTPSRGRW